jgi:hypothetical protein
MFLKYSGIASVLIFGAGAMGRSIHWILLGSIRRKIL